MVKAGIRLNTFLLLGFLIGNSRLAASAPLLPDTETGDVIIRSLDVLVIPGLPTYLGHAGIFSQWNGHNASDPTDYTIYDMQPICSTCSQKTWNINPPSIIASSTTILQRTFYDFTRVNSLIPIINTDYGGGWVRADKYVSAAGPAMTPSSRQAISDQAIRWLGRPLTTSLLFFTKNPAANTFRCDGWVEYAYELAGVNYGQGLWNNAYEHFIPSPAYYASLAGQLEHGKAPAMTMTTTGGGTVTDGSAISSNTITITGTEEATGSGLAQIALNTTTAAVSGLTGTATFSSLADGQYTATVTDLAGNQASASFMVGTTRFLVENAA